MIPRQFNSLAEVKIYDRRLMNGSNKVAYTTDHKRFLQALLETRVELNKKLSGRLKREAREAMIDFQSEVSMCIMRLRIIGALGSLEDNPLQKKRKPTWDQLEDIIQGVENAVMPRINPNTPFHVAVEVVIRTTIRRLSSILSDA